MTKSKGVRPRAPPKFTGPLAEPIRRPAAAGASLDALPELIAKFGLLADHYGARTAEGIDWQRLTIEMATDLVPGFQIESEPEYTPRRGRGAPILWDDKLVAIVRALTHVRRPDGTKPTLAEIAQDVAKAQIDAEAVGHALSERTRREQIASRAAQWRNKLSGVARTDIGRSTDVLGQAWQWMIDAGTDPAGVYADLIEMSRRGKLADEARSTMQTITEVITKNRKPN